MKTNPNPAFFLFEENVKEPVVGCPQPTKLRENLMFNKLFPIVAAAWLLTGTDSLMAASVEPEIIDKWTSGNAAFECDQAGPCGEFAYKIDDWSPNKDMNGNYMEAGNTINISEGTGKTFNWSSEYPVCTVIVVGAGGANIYRYDDAYFDSGLVGYLDRDISHVTFCFNSPTGIPVTVTKTAETTFTRKHFWEIAKKVETENGYELDGIPKIWLFTDHSGDETATWTIDVTYGGYEDRDFKVSGEITVFNSGTMPVEITGIVDELEGIEIDCEVELPVILLVGETLTCNYSGDGYFEGFNLVTVTTRQDGNDVDYQAEAEFIWGDPATEVDKTVHITDVSDLSGPADLVSVTAPDNARLSEITEFKFADYGADSCGGYHYNNIATIVETEQSAKASLKVNVQCYLYETAYAKGDAPTCFSPTFANWGWTNFIAGPADQSRIWDLWAGAADCDLSKGAHVGKVQVTYLSSGVVAVAYWLSGPIILKEHHVYAGKHLFPNVRGRETVAPGAYYIENGLSGGIYVIAHAVVGIPDPNFGPAVP